MYDPSFWCRVRSRGTYIIIYEMETEDPLSVRLGGRFSRRVGPEVTVDGPRMAERIRT